MVQEGPGSLNKVVQGSLSKVVQGSLGKGGPGKPGCHGGAAGWCTDMVVQEQGGVVYPERCTQGGVLSLGSTTLLYPGCTTVPPWSASALPYTRSAAAVEGGRHRARTARKRAGEEA